MTIFGALGLDAVRLSAELAAQGVTLQGADVVAQSASTNSDLVQHVTRLHAHDFFFVDDADSADLNRWRAPSLLATTRQTQGRGRLGRSWIAAPDTSLTFSLHLEVDVPPGAVTWLPLVVGAAIASELRVVTGVDALVKWPNDIVVASDGPAVDGWAELRKIGGVLIERVGARSFVVGVGINVSQSQEQVPVAWATSLALLGLSVESADVLLASVVRRILDEVAAWEDASGDVVASGQRTLIEGLSVTLGSVVRVENSDGSAVEGTVSSLLADGSLEIAQNNGENAGVFVGDVGHLRLR